MKKYVERDFCMQKRKTIIITITIAIIIATIFITNKTYATEADISSNFVDENLRNAILDLAKEAAGDEEKTEIYESDIEKIIEMPGGTSLKLAGKGIRNLSRDRNICKQRNYLDIPRLERTNRFKPTIKLPNTNQNIF